MFHCNGADLGGSRLIRPTCVTAGGTLLDSREGTLSLLLGGNVCVYEGVCMSECVREEGEHYWLYPTNLHSKYI